MIKIIACIKVIKKINYSTAVLTTEIKMLRSL